MNHRIKMIGLDMDGTLLTTEKQLTAYTKQILQEAIEQGIEVVLLQDVLLPVFQRNYWRCQG